MPHVEMRGLVKRGLAVEIDTVTDSNYNLCVITSRKGDKGTHRLVGGTFGRAIAGDLKEVIKKIGKGQLIYKQQSLKLIHLVPQEKVISRYVTKSGSSLFKVEGRNSILSLTLALEAVGFDFEAYRKLSGGQNESRNFQAVGAKQISLQF